MVCAVAAGRDGTERTNQPTNQQWLLLLPCLRSERVRIVTARTHAREFHVGVFAVRIELQTLVVATPTPIRFDPTRRTDTKVPGAFEKQTNKKNTKDDTHTHPFRFLSSSFLPKDIRLFSDAACFVILFFFG